MIISCSKESGITEETNKGDIVPTEEKDQNALLTRSVTSENGLNLDCITILYSFDVVDNEDETHTITSDDDFNALFDPENETFIVDFVYPLDIEDEDGNTSTVENGEELGEAFANCLPNEWDEEAFPAYLINLENSCLTLQYPVTVSKLDGSTATYDDEASFVAALAEEPLFFVFPLSLTNEDGETIVANDVDELLTALFDCNGLDIDTTIWDEDFGFEYIGCYEIVFPFSVELTDGTIVEVNNHMEYCDLLLEGNIQGFAFPMTLINAEGETVTVNNQEELDALIAECFDFEGEMVGDLINLFIGGLSDPASGIDPCFEISFPMSAVEVDWEGNEGNEITFNSFEEILEVFEAGPDSPLYNIIYPVTVTLTSTGEEIELQNTNELIELLITCQ